VALILDGAVLTFRSLYNSKSNHQLRMLLGVGMVNGGLFVAIVSGLLNLGYPVLSIALASYVIGVVVMVRFLLALGALLRSQGASLNKR
jgi:sorbitol-specific phosphotransferase system component IIC